MKVLIVHAHEEPRSFNAAMKNTAIRVFEEMGHTVVVSDLYRMRFKAVADSDDFLERKDRHILVRQAEERYSTNLGTLAPDILEEQRKVLDCQLLILQFPLWWFSLPAVLKGWVDRVLSMGFAYDQEGRWYDHGGLKGRRAMLSLTTGDPESCFSPRGIHGSMDQVLWPIQHNTLYHCGFEVMAPFVAYAVARRSQAEREALLQAYAIRLRGLDGEAPLAFHPLERYGDGMQLKAGFEP
ncbi:MAG: NAD(P)H-dependent oxidoreductase [Acidobacteria bacterium]|nr:NAD(P)H-dependent oxidoreductase [Acidobacteriota bacterium]